MSEINITKNLAQGLVEAMEIWVDEPDIADEEPEEYARTLRLIALLKQHQGGSFTVPSGLSETMSGELDNEIDKYGDAAEEGDLEARHYVNAAKKALRELGTNRSNPGIPRQVELIRHTLQDPDFGQEPAEYLLRLDEKDQREILRHFTEAEREDISYSANQGKYNALDVGDQDLVEDWEELERFVDRYGEQPRENPGPPEKSRQSADQNFEMWHRKTPRRDNYIKNAIDPAKHHHMACIGWATDIVYSSDKWEKDGVFYPYEHDFSSRPKVYVPSSSVPKGEKTVGQLRNTARFLGESSLSGVKALAQLAFVEELIYEDVEGDECRLMVGAKAKMASSPDKKTLIILASFGPVFVSGGRMVITSRGIVK